MCAAPRFGNYRHAANSACPQALEREPDYVKALQRRAIARRERGDADGSLADLDAALRLLPADAALSRELRSTLRTLAQEQGLLLPSALVRLVTHCAAEPSSPAPLITEHVPASQSGSGGASAHPAAAAPDSTATALSVLVAEPPSAHAATAPISAAQPPAPVQAAPCTAVVDAAAVESHFGTAAAPAAAAGTSRVPANSTEFEVLWRACKGDLERQAAVLATLTPASLPDIFKSSLTPAVLAGVAQTALATCAASVEQTRALAYLAAMTRVDRFGMNAMLVSGPAKSTLRGAWDAAAAALEVDSFQAELAELRKLYRV